MAAVWGSVFGVLSFGSSLASSIFAYKAYSEAGSVPNGSSDSNITSARSLLLWAAVIAWIVLALIIIVILLFVFYYRSTYSISGFIILLAVVLFILTLIVGILCAIAASRIHQSNLYTNSGAVYTAYWDAVVGAILSLVTAGFILIIFIIYLVAYSRPSVPVVVAAVASNISDEGQRLRQEIAAGEKKLEENKAVLARLQAQKQQAEAQALKDQQQAAAQIARDQQQAAAQTLKDQQQVRSVEQSLREAQARLATNQLALSELEKQFGTYLQAQSAAAQAAAARAVVVPATLAPPPAIPPQPVGVYAASNL